MNDNDQNNDFLLSFPEDIRNEIIDYVTFKYMFVLCATNKYYYAKYWTVLQDLKNKQITHFGLNRLPIQFTQLGWNQYNLLISSSQVKPRLDYAGHTNYSTQINCCKDHVMLINIRESPDPTIIRRFRVLDKKSDRKKIISQISKDKEFVMQSDDGNIHWAPLATGVHVMHYGEIRWDSLNKIDEKEEPISNSNIYSKMNCIQTLDYRIRQWYHILLDENNNLIPHHINHYGDKTPYKVIIPSFLAYDTAIIWSEYHAKHAAIEPSFFSTTLLLYFWKDKPLILHRKMDLGPKENGINIKTIPFYVIDIKKTYTVPYTGMECFDSFTNLASITNIKQYLKMLPNSKNDVLEQLQNAIKEIQDM